MIRHQQRYLILMALGAFLFTYRAGSVFSQEQTAGTEFKGSDSADEAEAKHFGSSLDRGGKARISLDRSRTIERGSKEKVRFQSQLPKEVTNFKLFEASPKSDETSLDEQVDSFLRQYDLDSSIEMRKIRVDQKATGRQSIVYGFYIHSIPIYDVFLTAHLVHGNLYFAGDLPLGSVAIEALGKELLPTANELTKVVGEFIAREDFLFDPQAFPSLAGRPCIASANSFTFHMAACFNVLWKGTSYRGIATKTEVLEMERQSFDVTAQLSYYQKNPSVPIVTGDFEVNDSGFLENNFFATSPPSGQRFQFSAGSLVGPSKTSDPYFPEANVFAQANDMMSWFNSLGYNWDNKRITLSMNLTDASNLNNAAYLPNGYLGSNGPAILIGQGDGSVLKNLSLDSDVVGHELGHHMVFRTITSTRYVEVGSTPNHSGAIHEGMADFFVFARSGEPCLGDNICPRGSDICIQLPTSTKQGCLRDAGLDKTIFSFSSPAFQSLPTEAHVKGMLVSGLLWDAFELSGKSAEFSKLVLNSIDYLVTPASTFDDLVTALLSSDFELFRGKYCDNIRTAATARGLGDAVPASCSKVGMSLKANAANPIMGAPQSPVVKKKVTLSKKSGCSISSESMDPMLLSWLLMIPVLLPYSLKFIRNRRLSFSRHK